MLLSQHGTLQQFRIFLKTSFT